MVAGYPLEVSRVLGPRRITVIHKDGMNIHRFTIVFFGNRWTIENVDFTMLYMVLPEKKQTIYPSSMGI